MSGIAGIYYPDGKKVVRDYLTQMTDAIAHRGADGVNFWYEANIGFAHRMLHTTPESLTEHLPLVDSTGNYIITAEARIDNREELLSQLQLASDLSSIADSELILKAYIKWGKDCPDKLLGDFVFAIWDRHQRKLFCARDHFGVKPFYYYYQKNRGFIFASEIKAIVRLPEVPIEISEARIGDYLTYTLEDREITSYQNIWRLPAAHTLTISQQDNLKLNSYWSLKPKEEIKFQSDSEYAEKFLEIFTEAVRCRLRSAFPIGSHLSGGLDSSSVTCVARNLLDRQGLKLHTFSNVFDSVPESNERNYIETVINQGGIIPHFIHADSTGPLSEWEEFYKYCDESLIGNCYLVWGLNRATQQSGVRIVLNGFDGDTTVSHGVLRLKELIEAGQWKKFVSEGIALGKNFQEPVHLLLRDYSLKELKYLAKKGKWLSFLKAVNIISSHVKISSRRLIIDYGLKSLFPDRLKQSWRKFRHGKSVETDPFPFINPVFSKRIDLQERVKKLTPKDPSTVKEHHLQQLTSGLMSIPLEGIDTFSAAFGIESRCPFMDKRLIEYCLALPVEQKLDQGWSRIVLRRAMEGILPSEIQWRGGKSSVTPAMVEGLTYIDRKIMESAIVNRPQTISKFINYQQVDRFYHKIIKNNKVTEKTIISSWSIISLNLWLRKIELKKNKN